MTIPDLPEWPCRYFRPEEFASPDCPNSSWVMNHYFLLTLDLIRCKAGIPLIVTSGYRTVRHNREVGGEPNSAHLTGKAVDFAVHSSPERFKLIEAALYYEIQRIGIGTNFVHLDCDPDKPQGVIWTYPAAQAW